MHILTDWTARRSGAFVRVAGTDNETGERKRFTATEVAGPCVGRVAMPRHTVAWLKDGNPVVLA